MRGVWRGGGLIDRQHRPRGHAAADQPQRQFVAVLLGKRGGKRPRRARRG